jgi:hypothetical protein
MYFCIDLAEYKSQFNMEIVGRKHELATFERLLTSRESEFLAVYGRRRVGKTYLIRSAFHQKMTFDCTALMNAPKEEQLLNFWITLSKVHSIPNIPPNTWLKTFHYLEEYLDTLKPKKDQKKIIFFDEISWFDTAKSGFLPAFTQFWNSYCTKRTDILLIICGSAASWIIDKVINSKGGLHNRLTQTIRLDAFDLEETKAYLKYQRIKLSDKDIALLYMCIGGIPYYLRQVLPGQGIAQILDHLFFGTDATLKTEFQNLYASLFKNHDIHVAVVKALAKKTKGLTRNEIINATKLPSGGGLTTILNELEECGFIMKTADIDKKKEDGLFRLMDEYSLFYFQFLERRTDIRSGAFLINSHSFKSWSGFAFENLCFRHHKKIAQLLGINGINYQIYSFIDKGSIESSGAQIDLIFDRADNVVNIIEAKFHNVPITINKLVGQDIANKIMAFQRKTKSKKTVFVTLVTALGADKNENYFAHITNELLITQFFN